MSLMCLGQFVFSLPTLAYTELRRASDWRHPSNSRVGARPARQYAGPGDDTITLTGIVAPDLTGTRASLEELRVMADQGLSWVLVDGAGYVYGAMVIEHLEDPHTLFFADGTARRIEFSLKLARTDNNLTNPIGQTRSTTQAASGSSTITLP